MSGERFLVTGSDGCIGSWVVKLLAERGEACVALDLTAEGTRVRRIAGESALETVDFVAGDITDAAVLPALLDDHRVTRVIHLAALQIPFVRADPVAGALVNVVGTVNVLEAVRRSGAGLRGMVYASSTAVYGPPGTGIAPATLYGVFKRCNEETARLYWSDFGVSSIGLRPWAVYGPGRDQGLTAAPTHAMKAAVLGVSYRIPFSGRLDLQYAPDVAEAFIRAALADVSGAPLYNLRGAVVEVADVIAAIERARPEASGLLTVAPEPLEIETQLEDGAEELIGPLPRTDLETGVRETIAHFERLRERGELSKGDLPAAA